jgi:hypothetical protein
MTKRVWWSARIPWPAKSELANVGIRFTELFTKPEDFRGLLHRVLADQPPDAEIPSSLITTPHFISRRLMIFSPISVNVFMK